MSKEQISREDFANFKGIWIPAEIFFNRDLSRLERDLIVDIHYLSNNDSGCWKSNAAFADFHGVCESSIVKALTNLRKAGYVHTAAFNGRDRYLKVDRARFFGVSPGKNSYAGQEKIPAPTRRKVLGAATEKPVQDTTGEQLRSPRSPLKGTKKAVAAETPGLNAPASTTASFSPSAFLEMRTPLGLDWVDASATPSVKTELFIKGYKVWGKLAGLITSVSVNDKTAVADFFRENEEFKVRDLLVILLAAWMMEERDSVDETGYRKYWNCKIKGRRVGTFIQFLTQIQDETEWDGSDKQTMTIFSRAHKRFAVEGRKLSR